ncbi:Putative E3 ubiquitin-protein ligase HERC1 [Durusdinium trenchii]|uniref:E3 ubiquitin-protein ligase HERC1 n=1 Tax=Durusdinium trenchii TaxID=1381693 RepID=A0ABP0IUF1_9DINO
MYHLKCSHSRASHSYPIYLEIKPATYEQCAIRGGLEHIKQEVDLCAKQVGLKKLERTIMDMQEESARLREVVHEKFFQIQDQERREVMAAFAARWDPYNKTRLLRKTVDGWVEFLRRQNKSREALARVKQVYAKTHVTARLRSWWYLMQRDHTDGQFKRLSENLETQEAKLEGARGALLRHEKATSEQARNLQYRVLAVEKGLEAAEREKATKQEVTESLGEIDRRLTEELSLNPIREDIVHIKDLIQKLQDDKMDAVDAEADRDKVHGFCSEFRTWLQRHDESIKRKAEISENDTKADARTIEQVLVLLAKQADQLATVVAHDFDQLRKALTRFLEISPDFRKASLAIGFEPHEQCVACRALPRKCANDGATGSDGVVYKLSMDTSISTIEETQKMLAEKLRYPLSLASNAFGCARPLNNRAEDTDTVSDQQLPLLRQIVLAESGWLAGKESLPDRIAFSRKLVHTEAPSLQDVPIPVATPRSKRRPPSAQDAGRDRPQSVRSYFPAVGGPGGSAQKAR